MLTRQRQLLQQQQATKRTASTQLPPAGGSSAGRPKAVAQRTAAAVRQKVQQDVTVTRALADNMRRNQERANRQIPPDKSPKVRRVGPGGANPSPQGQLPPGQRGGEIRSRGGALATRSSGGPITRSSSAVTPTNSGGPVQPVRVQDLGNTTARQLPGQRSLTGGTGGADTVRGSGVRTGRPGAPRPALPSSVAGTAAKPAVKGARLGGMAAAAIGEVAGAALSPLARAAGTKLGQALRPVGRAIDDRLPGINSKDEAARRQRSTPLRQMTADERRRATPLRQATPTDATPRRATPTPKPSTAAPTRSTTSRGSSAPTRTSTTTRPGSAPARRAAAPASNAGMNNQDKNYRGNLFEKTFGYKPGEAPSQVKSRQDKAANPDNFDTKADTYQPQTKVDGSRFADMKIDMKKAKEYDRRKRRLND